MVSTVEKIEYTIIEHNFVKLQDKVKYINNKAKKLGLPIVEVTVTGEKFTTLYNERNNQSYDVKFLTVVVSGELPKIEGYNCIAKLEFLNDEIMVLKTSDVEVPSRYKSIENSFYCEHCNSNRQRNKVYILQSTDTHEFMQVGKSCLMDYTGNKTIEDIVEYLERFFNVFTDLNGYDLEDIETGRAKSYLSLNQFVRFSTYFIKNYGYQKTNDGQLSTGEKVIDLLYSNNKEAEALKKEIEANNDYNLFESVKTFVDGLDCTSDYNNNCRIIFKDDYIEYKHKNFVSSCVNIYLNSLNKKVEVEAENVKPSTFIGNVGDKITKTVELIRLNSFESDYGTICIYTFNDVEGNVYVWFTSKVLEIEINTSVSITGTIKEHKEYKETKQNILTRCKVK